jgi:hypothetical protein
VTGLAALVSTLAPADYAAPLVAGVFAGATYLLVLRQDTDQIESHGLALGGLFTPEPLAAGRMLQASRRALLFSGGACLITLPPFWLGYVMWFSVDGPFDWRPDAAFFDAALGHLLVVALPEEMFYRGVVQTQLDRAFPPTRQLLGAKIGLGLILTSAIFALGHLLSTPNPARLAVFFPSLAFGWLRARSGGIGSAVLYHAACNIFAATLAQGYAD